jgi:hypothetical protein
MTFGLELTPILQILTLRAVFFKTICGRNEGSLGEKWLLFLDSP